MILHRGSPHDGESFRYLLPAAAPPSARGVAVDDRARAVGRVGDHRRRRAVRLHRDTSCPQGL